MLIHKYINDLISECCFGFGCTWFSRKSWFFLAYRIACFSFCGIALATSLYVRTELWELCGGPANSLVSVTCRRHLNAVSSAVRLTTYCKGCTSTITNNYTSMPIANVLPRHLRCDLWKLKNCFRRSVWNLPFRHSSQDGVCLVLLSWPSWQAAKRRRKIKFSKNFRTQHPQGASPREG